MGKRAVLVDHLVRAARAIEDDVEQLSKTEIGTDVSNSFAEAWRASVEAVARSVWALGASIAVLARLEAGRAQPNEDDDALLNRIQSRFDHLPRKGSIVDELIAERRIEAWRDELDSHDR